MAQLRLRVVNSNIYSLIKENKMDIYLIISILLIIITMLVIFFANEDRGAKMYKAICASAMAVIGVFVTKMIVTNASI